MLCLFLLRCLLLIVFMRVISISDIFDCGFPLTCMRIRSQYIKKSEISGEPESWKSAAYVLNWPRAPSYPWIGDQGNQRSWSLYLEELSWANQKSARQCLGPACEMGRESAGWGSAGWDRTRAVHIMGQANLFNFSEGEEWWDLWIQVYPFPKWDIEELQDIICFN